MNYQLIKVLGVISGLLLLILLGEWLYASISQQAMLDAQLPKDKKALIDAMPTIDLTADSEESYVDLVERPLFIEGRKPVVEPPPDAVNAEMVASAKLDWLLSGVYTSKKGMSALLTHVTPLKTRKETYRRLTVGMLLDGWKLLEIKKDRVVFALDGGQKELLLHKAKPKGPPKPGEPQPQPGEQPEGVPPDGQNPEGVPPTAPEGEPEDLMQEPESLEEPIENSENE